MTKRRLPLQKKHPTHPTGGKHPDSEIISKKWPWQKHAKTNITRVIKSSTATFHGQVRSQRLLPEHSRGLPGLGGQLRQMRTGRDVATGFQQVKPAWPLVWARSVSLCYSITHGGWMETTHIIRAAAAEGSPQTKGAYNARVTDAHCAATALSAFWSGAIWKNYEKLKEAASPGYCAARRLLHIFMMCNNLK